MQIICQQETLLLLAERAIYWPRRKTLLLADLHLGKSGYFRERGIPIPASVMLDDLQRLKQLVIRYQPETILVAGDMFHHDHNSDIRLFDQWRQQFPDLQWVLVPGNHDRLLDIDYQQLGIQLSPTVHELEPFRIVHEPSTTVSGFQVNGHLHPGYRLQGRARQQVRLSCFIVTDSRIILPAFSSFTGLYTGYRSEEHCKNYLIVNNQVIPAE